MQNTITIKVAKATTTDKIVTLPYCTKSESGLYYDKVIEEYKTISIEINEHKTSVKSYASTNPIEISEEEFNTKFNEVIENIKSINK